MRVVLPVGFMLRCCLPHAELARIPERREPHPDQIVAVSALAWLWSEVWPDAAEFFEDRKPGRGFRTKIPCAREFAQPLYRRASGFASSYWSVPEYALPAKALFRCVRGYTRPAQLEWPQLHTISVLLAMPSQWALQYFDFSAAGQLQAAFAHFLELAIILLCRRARDRHGQYPG